MSDFHSKNQFIREIWAEGNLIIIWFFEINKEINYITVHQNRTLHLQNLLTSLLCLEFNSYLINHYSWLIPLY